MVKKVVNSIIAVAFMFLFGFLSPVDPITPMGMKVLGVFIGCIWAWLTVDVFWPSILGLVALGFTGYMSVPQVFSSAFSNNNVILILFMMILGGLIVSSGLADVLAKKMLSMNVIQGKPWAIAVVLMVIALLLSAMFGGAPGAIIICWSLLYAICDQVGYKPGDKYPMLVASAVVFSGTCGNHIFPFHMAVVAPMGFCAEPVDFGTGYTLFTLVFIPACLAIYTIAMKYILKPDVSLIVNGSFALDGTKNFDGKQKIVLTLVVIMVILLLLPNFLPKTNAITVFLNKIGQPPIIALTIAVATFITYKGEACANITKSIQAGVVWPVFFMVLAAFTIATALTSQDTGISPFISKTVAPLFAGKGLFVFSAIAVILAAVGTNCVNNMIVAAIFIPIATTLAAAANTNPAIIATLLVYATAVGIALPTGSPAGAMFFGNKAWIPGNSALKLGLFAIAIHTLMLIFVGYPLACLVY